jgi:hypothetical protein
MASAGEGTDQVWPLRVVEHWSETGRTRVTASASQPLCCMKVTTRQVWRAKFKKELTLTVIIGIRTMVN